MPRACYPAAYAAAAVIASGCTIAKPELPKVSLKDHTQQPARPVSSVRQVAIAPVVVSGAEGDTNTSLAKRMEDHLIGDGYLFDRSGPVVIRATVSATRITWVVMLDGKPMGIVSQATAGINPRSDARIIVEAASKSLVKFLPPLPPKEI